MSPRTWRVLAALALTGVVALAAVYAYVKLELIPGLPATDSLRELKLEQPLRVYTADGKLIGEFGAERRDPIDYADIPESVIQAFLAAEDDRFFEHPGVDWQGLARAAFSLLVTGEKRQGGSTITMQLARNVFLTRERTYLRKAREILLALQIERDLSKEEILELYLNKIYLGNRAYGIGAAAPVYFDREIDALNLSQTAILAGLPKAPSRDNPITNPNRARERRDYVLRRMFELGNISKLDYEATLAEPVATRAARPPVEVDAHYVTEMVRSDLFEQYGEDAYRNGYNVTTTIDSELQEAANAALRAAVIAYGERHEYPGPEARVSPETLELAGGDASAASTAVDEALDARPAVVGLEPAVVLEFAPKKDSAAARLKVMNRAHQLIDVPPAGFEWAKLEAGSLSRGDIVRILDAEDGWRLSMLPEVQGALVAVDPRDGSVRALVGGYDFFEGKFNRATQARRQAGSGFKPFLYAAALEYGFTPASVILDAPVVFDDPALEDTWRPENYTGKFYGPTRLREALVHSRNLVSIRLLLSTGINFVRRYATNFGFPADRMPRDLTLALGSASFTPMEMARAYSVLANGGFLVDPYYVARVVDADGTEVFAAQPLRACPECIDEQIEAAGELPGANPGEPGTTAETDEGASNSDRLAPRVVEPRVAYLTRDMMRDVVQRGTAARATQLGRGDLAGKTGTTNDEADAWFNGFQSSLVGVAWMGFDQPKPLGRGEVGGRAALPMWIDMMGVGLKGKKEDWPERPPGLISVRVDRTTGKLASAGSDDSIFEIVQSEHAPPPDTQAPDADEPEKARLDDLY